MGKGARPNSSLSVLSLSRPPLSQRLRELLEVGNSREAQELLADCADAPESLMESLIDVGETASDPAVSSRCRHLIAWLASEQQDDAWGQVAVQALSADIADPSTSPGFRDLAARKLEALDY